MRNKPWSPGEIALLNRAISDGVTNAEIYTQFPYRSPSSIRHKIGEIKTQIQQKQAETDTLVDWVESLKRVGPEEYTIPLIEGGINRRELEICIMDPHFGMYCHTPESDHPWDMNKAYDTVLWAIEELLALAEPFGPFEKIIFPFGNDFLHADNIFHTTTKGTLQPETVSWHTTYKKGKELAIAMVDRLREVAPVQIYQVPGNHALHSEYTLGLLLDAYYHNDRSVSVDCSASPFKYHRYGCNLIGFEHGNSISPIRLAALMANERPKDWAETSYREYHLGDQHRKATSKPSTFEEQGVSIEYLAGLTPPNAWHRTHAYNYQKRGAVAFVWNHDKGQEAKLMCNLDVYTGKPMGS